MKLGPGSLDTIVLTIWTSHLVRHDTIHTCILAHSKFMHENVCNTYCARQYISDMRCPTHVVDTIDLWLRGPTCTVVTTNVSNICCAIQNKQYYGHTKHCKIQQRVIASYKMRVKYGKIYMSKAKYTHLLAIRVVQRPAGGRVLNNPRVWRRCFRCIP